MLSIGKVGCHELVSHLGTRLFLKAFIFVGFRKQTPLNIQEPLKLITDNLNILEHNSKDLKRHYNSIRVVLFWKNVF